MKPCSTTPATSYPTSSWTTWPLIGTALLLGLIASAAGAAETSAISRVESQGPITVTATLEKSDVQIAEPVTLTLKVDAPEDVLVTLPQQQDKLGTWNVLSMHDTADLPTNDGRQWIRRYQVESLVPGPQTIPPISIAYSDQRSSTPTSDVIESPALELTVRSVLEGTPDPLAFRDIKDVVDLPHKETTSDAWLYWSASGAAALTFAAVALLVWPSRDRSLSAKQTALAQLNDLERAELLENGQTELFYVRLTNIVRHYIENQFDIAAPKLTTDEFLAEAVDSTWLDVSQQQTLREFLSTADLVKFARLEPHREDATDAIERARQFVQQSAVAATPAETKENA